MSSPHEQAPAPVVAAARRGRVGRGVGVVLLQGLNSITTVAQMAMFAIVLARGQFDDYVVWSSSGMFLVGLGQAIGTERVVIGRRTMPDGTRSARVLGGAIALAQVAVALALGNPWLAVCSIAVYAYVTYDFQRFVRCYDEATAYLRRDLSVLALQVAVTLVSWAVLGDQDWLVLGWWVVGAPIWACFSGRDPGGLKAGLAVLREDARQCFPLLLDAALSGVPLVIALALARAQGDVGDASSARMAWTLLGPITVLGMSARRIVYQRAATGPLNSRITVLWSGVCVLTFLGCTGVLAMTRTPLYPWVFPGFEGLAWLAILGFAVNHAAMFTTLLPAASLRAERRTFEIGVARIVATLTAVAALVLFVPFDSPTKVAWCVASGSIAYALALFAARLRTVPPLPEVTPPLEEPMIAVPRAETTE